MFNYYKLLFRAIASVHPHESYDPATLNNDILVLKVLTPFLITPTVQLIKMAAFGFEPKGNLISLLPNLTLPNLTYLT